MFSLQRPTLSLQALPTHYQPFPSHVVLPLHPGAGSTRSGSGCKHLAKSQGSQTRDLTKDPDGRGLGAPPSMLSSYTPRASSLCPLTKSHRAQFKSIVLLTVHTEAFRKGRGPAPTTPHPPGRTCAAPRVQGWSTRPKPPTPTPTLSFKNQKRTPARVAAARPPSPPFLPSPPSLPPPPPPHYTVTRYKTQTFFLQSTPV